MNKALIVANWKMNKTIAAAKAFVADFLDVHKLEDSLENIVICPPATLIKFINELPVKIGAQDCSSFTYSEGSYTGDISAKMLKDAGCEYVIIGHSERRKNYNESDVEIKNKIINAHQAGLKVIFCIGESLLERENSSFLDVLFNQITNSVPNTANSSNLLIAYEPVWAIGSGTAASVEQIAEVHEFIFKEFNSFCSLYGGSVNARNAKEILSIKNVSGLLVGSASLDAFEFSQIIKARG